MKRPFFVVLLFAGLLFISAAKINVIKISDSRFSEAFSYCRKNKMDTEIAFFADMNVHSGRNRFFIVDLLSKKILHSGLVCHGMGKGSTTESPVFSNEPGSNCTSLGKYKIGTRGYSNWGIHVNYKMHGQEKSNNKAAERLIVLHSYGPVPDKEIYPGHLPMGWSQGCPVISNSLMAIVDGLLKNRKKPVLIWIYN